MIMEIEKRTCLSAGEPIQGVLSEGLGDAVTTVSPVRVPMDMKMPYVIYGVSGETDKSDKLRNAIDACEVSLDIYAESYGDCVDISETVRSLLSRQRITHTFGDGSTLVMDCSRMSAFDDSMTDDGFYHRGMSFTVKAV